MTSEAIQVYTAIGANIGAIVTALIGIATAVVWAFWPKITGRMLALREMWKEHFWRGMKVEGEEPKLGEQTKTRRQEKFEAMLSAALKQHEPEVIAREIRESTEDPKRIIELCEGRSPTTEEALSDLSDLQYKTERLHFSLWTKKELSEGTPKESVWAEKIKRNTGDDAFAVGFGTTRQNVNLDTIENDQNLPVMIIPEDLQVEGVVRAIGVIRVRINETQEATKATILATQRESARWARRELEKLWIIGEQTRKHLNKDELAVELMFKQYVEGELPSPHANEWSNDQIVALANKGQPISVTRLTQKVTPGIARMDTIQVAVVGYSASAAAKWLIEEASKMLDAERRR